MCRRFVDAFFQFQVLFNTHSPPKVSSSSEQGFDSGFNCTRDVLSNSIRLLYITSKLTTMSVSNKDVMDAFEQEGIMSLDEEYAD